MAIVEDQMVEVKWSNNQQKYYIDKGYSKRKPSEIFLVRVSDLKPNSNKEVDVICDSCGKQYRNQLSALNKSKTHTCSGECQGNMDRLSGSRKTYSKDDLKNYYFKYYEEFGNYPLLKDLVGTKGYPSETAYKSYWDTYLSFLKEINMVRKDCKDGWYIHDENILRDKYNSCTREAIIDSLLVKRTWSGIVGKANKMGLKRNRPKRSRKYSDNYLINCLKDYYNETGQTPSADIFDNPDNDYPSYKNFCKSFGSWNNALLVAGLPINRHMNITKQDIISEAKIFYEVNGRSPYHYDLPYSISLIKKHYNLWSDMLAEAGLPINVKPRKQYTKSELIEIVKKFNNKFKQLPSTLKIEQEYDVNRLHFTNKFGSFSQCLYEAGLISKEEVNIDYDVYVINNIIYLRKLADQLNRIPSVSEYEEYTVNKDCLTRRNFSQRLGLTYSKICECYLPPHITFNANNHFFLNKSNYKCKSKPEVTISDLFIDNNISFTYENLYKEFINIKENYRFDWIIAHDDKVYMVEYFGYYREEEKDYKIVLDYTSKAKLKIDLCKNNGLTLIDLYPHDIENDFKGLISKFSTYGIKIINPFSEAI